MSYLWSFFEVSPIVNYYYLLRSEVLESERTIKDIQKKFGFVDGEQLIEYMRPHFMCALPQIVLTSVGVIALIPLIIFMRMSFNASWVAIAWVVFGVLGGLAIATAKKIVWWQTTRYVFTDHRIIVRTGLFSIKGDTIPLNRVQALQFEKTLFDRILGSGRLLIDSAAENDIVIKYVKRAEEIKHEIYAQIDRKEDEYRANNNGKNDERFGL